MPTRFFMSSAVLLLVIAPYSSLRAQEVDCTVQVNYESIATTNKDQLQNLASDIKDYVNNYKWGPENLPEKVKCTLNIFVQSVIGENKYQAQVFIGSQRKIYESEKNTAVVRLFDDYWEFTYVKSRPISHDTYTFNDLSSFLDFYMYVILGYDYDTYDPLGGTSLFQKAGDVANLGRTNGPKGWQPTTNAYSRVRLIDEILNPRFEPVRRASYQYHFMGLDSLALNPGRAYANILHAIETVGNVKKQVDPRNVIIKAFFDTKYMEIADLFTTYPDPNVYISFSEIDPNHQQTYEQYLQKRK